jgi:hypothetical protein
MNIQFLYPGDTYARIGREAGITYTLVRVNKKTVTLKSSLTSSTERISHFVFDNIFVKVGA